ncbi:hypothetical protein AC578_2812 [Pseudocercospora eumusae]|uniref:Uncharacterized protein n=1 Tax=Pseudocercospora eumusae TaxID=321146 RepID=A0A139HGV2_9PEZI|nr:hypothetical protein AC578_2812 [Pseudocercospora eumusae]
MPAHFPRNPDVAESPVDFCESAAGAGWAVGTGAQQMEQHNDDHYDRTIRGVQAEDNVYVRHESGIAIVA